MWTTIIEFKGKKKKGQNLFLFFLRKKGKVYTTLKTNKRLRISTIWEIPTWRISQICTQWNENPNWKKEKIKNQRHTQQLGDNLYYHNAAYAFLSEKPKKPCSQIAPEITYQQISQTKRKKRQWNSQYFSTKKDPFFCFCFLKQKTPRILPFCQGFFCFLQKNPESE